MRKQGCTQDRTKPQQRRARTLKRTPGISPTAWPRRPKPAMSTSSWGGGRGGRGRHAAESGTRRRDKAEEQRPSCLRASCCCMAGRCWLLLPAAALLPVPAVPLAASRGRAAGVAVACQPRAPLASNIRAAGAASCHAAPASAAKDPAGQRRVAALHGAAATPRGLKPRPARRAAATAACGSSAAALAAQGMQAPWCMHHHSSARTAATHASPAQPATLAQAGARSPR